MAVTGKCALCPADNVELIDSHVLPRWVYRRLHNLGHPGQLIATGGGKVGYSSKQDSKHLLCRACEDRFGEREQYVSGLVVQADDSFPALAMVTVESTVLPGVELAQPSGLDVDQLTYFACSVFWRADVAQSVPVVSLGGRGAAIGVYLLGGPFPDDVFLEVRLLDPAAASFAARTASAPESHPSGTLHDLVVLGIRFRLFTAPDLDTRTAAIALSLPHARTVIVDRRRQTGDSVAEEALTSIEYGKLARRGG